jgi:hypothetical protein
MYQYANIKNKKGVEMNTGLKSIGALAGGLAALSLLKNRQGSKSENHDVGKTGEVAFDVFEGSQPKIWFSMLFEQLTHPDCDPLSAQQLKQGNKLLAAFLQNAIKANLSFLEVVNLGRKPKAFNKYVNFLISKKRTPTQKNIKEANQVANLDVRLVEIMMTQPQTKHLLASAWHWAKYGSNVVVVGPNMQALFENTTLRDINIEDIKIPFDSVYIALPGFNGQIADKQSGLHYIRGIFITRLDEEWIGEGSSFGLTIWGKPKTHPDTNGYDDLYLYTGLPNLTGQNLEEYINNIFHGPDFNTRYQQPDECIEDLTKAVKIAFNVLMYWSSVSNRMELIHPTTMSTLNKIEDLKNRMEKTNKRKTKEGLKGSISGLEAELDKKGRLYWMEKTDEYFSSKPNTGDGAERGPLGYKRKSPKMHMRKGHYRTIQRDTDKERQTWIEPMLVGSTVAPRFWRTELEKQEDSGSTNKKPLFTLVRVERRKAGFKPSHMMRSFQRTGIPPHVPGGHDPNKIVGAAITIKSHDRNALSRYRQGGEFAQQEAKNAGIINPYMQLRNVHPSRSEANVWIAIWDAR